MNYYNYLSTGQHRYCQPPPLHQIKMLCATSPIGAPTNINDSTGAIGLTGVAYMTGAIGSASTTTLTDTFIYTQQIENSNK